MTPTYTPKTGLALDPEIAAVKAALRSATDDLIVMCTQLQAVSAVLPGNAGQVLNEVRQCIRMAIEAESDIEKRDLKTGASRGGPDIDLERARSSIRCRLDRLRDCRDTGRIPRRPE
ncbi:hypothetical protein [Shimia sp. SK013]|uniref:hypothetical protein n=1 Tax=Shimia sp. SK013 TaxID=1389006 RepID=UPI00187CA995|nr:hypothetical protein [Shimia sp. SK013]